MVLSLSVTAMAASKGSAEAAPVFQLASNYNSETNQVTAVVTLAGCSELATMEFHLVYSDDLLSFVSATPSVDNALCGNAKQDHAVKFTWDCSDAMGTEDFTESRPILTVVFDAAASGEASLKLANIEITDGESPYELADSSTLTSSVTLPTSTTQPTIPTQPDQPTQTEPTTPDQPTQTEPTTPDQPTQTEPTTPDQPTQTEPTTPTQPTQTEPTTPDQPTQTEPTTPDQPTQTEPTQPDQPTQTEPTTPDQPTQTDPTQPTQPDPDQPDPPADDLEVIPAGISPSSYTIDGQTVTVQSELACRVGYLQDGKYVALEATRTDNGAYVFTAPEGVEQVLLVVKGDANGDGKVTVADISQLLAHILRYITMDEVSQFAANADGNSSLTVADISTILAHILHYSTLEW